MKHVKVHIDEVMEEMGVVDGQPWQLMDYSKKIPWGQFRTLFRYHFMTMAALKPLLEGEPEQAALQLVLNLRSIHQALLDEGQWHTAWQLSHLPDPLGKKKFGGTARDLELIAGYNRSIKELEKKNQNPFQKKKPGQEEEPGEAAEEGGGFVAKRKAKK